MGELAVNGGAGASALIPVYNYLCDVKGWQAPESLAATCLAALVVATLLRSLAFLVIRATGQSHYTAPWHVTENTLTILMGIAGVLFGYLMFGNYLSACFCGAGWAFVMTGVALHALTANERPHQGWQ